MNTALFGTSVPTVWPFTFSALDAVAAVLASVALATTFVPFAYFWNSSAMALFCTGFSLVADSSESTVIGLAVGA